MRKQFIFREDPGHGWLMVTLAELHAVGLTESDISPYSYRKANTLALEEDLDAATFLDAFHVRHGLPELSNVHNGGEIRSWQSFGTRPSRWGNPPEPIEEPAK